MVILKSAGKSVNTTYPKQNYLILLFSIALLCIAIFLERRITWQASDYQSLTTNAQKALSKDEKSAKTFVDSISNKLASLKVGSWKEIQEASITLKKPKTGFTYFVYKDNQLIYWSNNTVLYDQSLSEKLNEMQLVYMKNGWYEYFGKKTGSYAVAAFLLVKYDYSYQNKYLDNDFNSTLKLPEYASLQVDSNKSDWTVKNANGKFLFGINYSREVIDTSFEIPLMILLFSSIAFLLLFLYSYGKHMLAVRPYFAFFIVGILVVLRMLGLFYRSPDFLYNLSLFSPEFYASSFLLNSLGDFLISVLVFTYLVVFFHHYFGTTKIKKDNGRFKLLISYQVVFVFLFTFLFSVFVNYLLSGLILDSKISFNINNIFELSGYSLIGFAIMGLLLFSFYLICDGSIRFIQKTDFTAGQISILFLITQGLFLILLLWLRDTELFQDYGVSSFLLANSLIVYISYIRSSSKRLFSFTRSLLVILGFSLYAAKTIADFNEVKEKENRKLLAVKLENEHDLVAEYLFEEVAVKIAKDRFIHAVLLASSQQVFPSSFNPDVLSKRILQLYLTNYWGKFDMHLSFFDKNKKPLQFASEGKSELEDFEQVIKSQGMPTNSKGFYLISNNAGRLTYLGKIDIDLNNDSLKAGTLMIEFNARFVQNEGGFPDLLLSNRIPERKDFSNYSYAKYEFSKLINQYGKYPYYIQSKSYEDKYGEGKVEKFIDFNGYSHLFYRHGSTGLIIVSKQNQNIVVLLTLFSYIFTFFCLFFVIIYSVYKLVKNGFRFEINFKTRIQFMVFTIVMATILLTGGGTIYYIISNYSTSQNQKVSERLSSLLVLLENELGRTPFTNQYFSEDLSFAFSRLSSYLGVDFNLFDTKGKLIYSTQPKIYDKEILARTMNSIAYEELHIKQLTSFLQYEQIGSLNFLSAYEPLRDANANIIGYVNIPYIAKQNVLKKEISSLLVTLINIYVFLFSLAMFVTFIISNRITRPLGLIQQKLSQIKIGKRTDPIEWARKDEIGGLVNEYNSMVEELHNSVDKLAKSERESAWREMAKQVAHEIKNPLTPMKLSVQHLKKAWQEKSPNLDSIMQRLSQTLIEQIDTLSNIANEFSNFAKMPKAENSVLDLSVILEHTVNLYAESEKVKINYTAERYRNMHVFADKDQLLRAFSNLFKNAIQAIPETREGLIQVKIQVEKSNYIISFADNGEGIADDKIEKIFVPNFTTKTTGTGLGLAMVKNIVELTGGKIWFETKAGDGTTFYIQFPAYHETENSKE